MSSSDPEPDVQGGTPSGAPVSWHLPRLFVAWGIAAIAGVLVTLLAGDKRAEWLAIAVGVATLATFALQLGTAQREGFISRLSFSIAGSVVVIAVIDVTGMIIESLSAAS